MKMPSVIVATGSSLGCRSMKKPFEVAAHAEELRHLRASWRGSMPTLRTTMSTGMRRCLPMQGVLRLHDELALLVRACGRRR